MRKKIGVLLGWILCVVAFGTTHMDNIGMIYEEDFRSVGVSNEEISKAKKVILDASTKYKLLLLDKKQLELEINKYMLEGAEKNWNEISRTFDELGKIEAEIMKNKLKTQIEVQKYISQEEYVRARDLAIRRLEEEKKKKSENYKK